MSDLYAHYYTWAEVCLLTTLSEGTIRTKVEEGTFPPIEQLSRRRVGFRKTAVDLWLKDPEAWERRNRRRLAKAARRRQEEETRRQQEEEADSRDKNVAGEAVDTTIAQL